MTFYLFSLAEVYSTLLTACNTQKLSRGQGVWRGNGTSLCVKRARLHRTRIQMWCCRRMLHTDREREKEMEWDALCSLCRHCQIPGYWLWRTSIRMQSMAHNLLLIFFIHMRVMFWTKVWKGKYIIYNVITIF